MLIVMYSIGIIGIGAKEILDRAFYAVKDTKTPAINGFIIMGVNIILSLVLIKFIGAYGIPLAYSVASLTGSIVLLIRLNRKIGSYLKGFFPKLFKAFAASAVMGAAAFGTLELMNGIFSGNGILERIITLLAPAGVGVIVYAVMLLILRVDMAVSFAEKIFKKKD